MVRGVRGKRAIGQPASLAARGGPGCAREAANDAPTEEAGQRWSGVCAGSPGFAVSEPPVAPRPDRRRWSRVSAGSGRGGRSPDLVNDRPRPGGGNRESDNKPPGAANPCVLKLAESAGFRTHPPPDRGVCCAACASRPEDAAPDALRRAGRSSPRRMPFTAPMPFAAPDALADPKARDAGCSPAAGRWAAAQAVTRAARRGSRRTGMGVFDSHRDGPGFGRRRRAQSANLAATRRDRKGCRGPHAHRTICPWLSRQSPNWPSSRRRSRSQLPRR